MRRFVTILAGAALALALVGPAVAGATEKASGSTTFTAQHYGGGHGHGGSHHDGRRDGHRDGRSRHGYDHHRGGCYGCGYYYGYPYSYGYYYGGYGCNYDYPCGPPYRQYDCSRYRGRDGQAAQNPQCQWNDRCQCYYHGSAPGSENQGPPPSG